MAEKLTMADIAELAGSYQKYGIPGILTGKHQRRDEKKDPECGRRE